MDRPYYWQNSSTAGGRSTQTISIQRNNDYGSWLVTSTAVASASTPIDIECAGTQFWDMGAIKRNDRCDSRINCIHKMNGQQI